jgi:molybdopterin-biosynthesis enzyme MoeA-like protein
VVPDALDPVADAVREAAAAADVTVVTGGIGPTHDDCTRPAVARALDVPLVVHPEARRRLQALFAGKGTEEEEAMALLPRGAELIEAAGTRSFGFRVNSVRVFPGVPQLLRPLFTAHADSLQGTPTHRREAVTRVREGRLARPLQVLAAAWPDVTWGSYPELTPEGWRLRLVLRGPAPDRLEAALGALRAVIDRLENTPR